VAVEVSTLLDREGHVMDVGFNVTGGLQGNRLSTDDARDSAAHDDLLARDHPRHLSFLTDNDLGRANVTFNLTIDLQAAAANDLEPLANNLEIVAYMTDFSPLEGGLMASCAPLAPAERVC
jgi:hypothetical protein